MLTENAFKTLTASELKPKGWLKRQLRLQADGQAGNLDKMWPDVRDSAWIGGSREGWERVPYWLDGFIPLAWLLDDEDMKKRAKKYIDAIIAGQCEDGWICPCSLEQRPQYDMWAAFLICKVLTVYADCSGDPRIEAVISKALKNLSVHVKTFTVFNWASSRWFEALISIFWLYERIGEGWLMELAFDLYSQGRNYRLLFDHWYGQVPKRVWTQPSHVVNLAMALKCEALVGRMTGEDGAPFCEKMMGLLMKHHSMPTGIFTGDECLSGDSPIQGAELCSVVEAMYSYEQLLAITGNPVWADRLERAAYNALPATTSPDMWTHQYDQMTNQAFCTTFEGEPVFGTNGKESNLFGLEPNYGCCTANFGQGWPKFALSTFMKGKNSLVSAVLAPSEVTTKIGGASVSCRLETDYPFRDTLTYTVTTDKPVSFDFLIRIPGSCVSALVDGAEAVDCTKMTGKFFTVSGPWSGTREITVLLKFKPELIKRPSGLNCLQRGNLVFSVPVEAKRAMREYTKDGVERRFPYCDYELSPISPWNYAFAGDEFTVQEHAMPEMPFSTTAPGLTVSTKLAEIDWGLEEGYANVCAAHPHSTVSLTAPEKIALNPYGCTDLRMTELPIAD